MKLEPMQHHYRVETTITPYVGETVAGEPIKIHGLIPISIEDTTDPAVEAEIVSLAAEGMTALAEDKLNKIRNNKEGTTA